jgi:hypothetical protein
MSDDRIGTAMDALFLLGGGLGFARLGWGGLARRAAAAGSQPGSATALAPPARSAARQIPSALLLLFGGVAALAGLLLALSLFFPE